MLSKLLKYEFKATGRIYGGLYLAILIWPFWLLLHCWGRSSAFQRWLLIFPSSSSRPFT